MLGCAPQALPCVVGLFAVSSFVSLSTWRCHPQAKRGSFLASYPPARPQVPPRKSSAFSQVTCAAFLGESWNGAVQVTWETSRFSENFCKRRKLLSTMRDRRRRTTSQSTWQTLHRPVTGIAQAKRGLVTLQNATKDLERSKGTSACLAPSCVCAPHGGRLLRPFGVCSFCGWNVLERSGNGERLALG
jgi:hypothetical protein